MQENRNRNYRLFTNVINQINTEVGQADILNTTVDELRHLLMCDRVLVYSLNQDSYGWVIAESVAAGWSKALGKTIDDPCFAARYIEKYSDGCSRAWDNVYDKNETTCYLEQLEAFEVKANLVAPIISDGQLFGLLIAHQCSGTRNWQEQEMNWITEIANQVGTMLKEDATIVAYIEPEEPQQLDDAQKQMQVDLDQTQKQIQADLDDAQKQIEEQMMWTKYLTDAIQQIRQSLHTEDILKSSVREVRRILNCDRVVVYSLNQDKYGMIVAESVARGWTKTEGRIIKDPCFEARYLDQYRDGRVRAWSNIYEAGMSRCYMEQLEKLEVKANLVTPIIKGEQLFGLLVAHQCSDTRKWQQPEILWLTQIAMQVGLALDNAKLLEQLEQSTKGTQEILERAVNNSSNIQGTVQNVAVVLDNFSHSCQKLSETVKTIKDLSKQMAQQSMSITRAVNLSQIERGHQNSITDLSDSIFSLMQELFEATGKIDPLFDNLKTETREKTISLESETQQLVSGMEEFKTARQKLDLVVTLNQEMSNLMENISHSLETQIQSSTFTENSVQEVASIAERISKQSMAITQSFNQLVGLEQKL